MNIKKRIPLIGSLISTLLAISVFSFVVYKFLGVAGLLGVIFVGAAVIGNVLLASTYAPREKDQQGR